MSNLRVHRCSSVQAVGSCKTKPEFGHREPIALHLFHSVFSGTGQQTGQTNPPSNPPATRLRSPLQHPLDDLSTSCPARVLALWFLRPSQSVLHNQILKAGREMSFSVVYKDRLEIAGVVWDLPVSGTGSIGYGCWINWKAWGEYHEHI